MNVQELRADVPALQEGVYMNFGAHGPSPRAVVEAATGWLHDHEYRQPIEDDPYEDAFEHDVKRRIPDSSKAKEQLGWEPRIDLEKSLDEYINWYRTELR